MTDPDDPSREQRNVGSGVFVGRDLHGSVNIQHLDDSTRKVLAKLSNEAPALAKLLEKALEDGIVSPESVYAIERAARSINEDTAGALLQASRNINEDVASDLHNASDKLDKTKNGLKAIVSEFDPSGRHGIVEILNAKVDDLRFEIDRIDEIHTPIETVDFDALVKSFLCGLVFGVVALAGVLGFISQH